MQEAFPQGISWLILTAGSSVSSDIKTIIIPNA